MSVEQPVVWLPGEAGDTEITASRLNAMQTGLIGPIETLQTDVTQIKTNFPIRRLHPFTFSVPDVVDEILLPPMLIKAIARQSWEIWEVNCRLATGDLDNYVQFDILVNNSAVIDPIVVDSTTWETTSVGLPISVVGPTSIGIDITEAVGEPTGLSISIQLRETIQAAP